MLTVVSKVDVLWFCGLQEHFADFAATSRRVLYAGLCWPAGLVCTLLGYSPILPVTEETTCTYPNMCADACSLQNVAVCSVPIPALHGGQQRDSH